MRNESTRACYFRVILSFALLSILQSCPRAAWKSPEIARIEKDKGLIPCITKEETFVQLIFRRSCTVGASNRESLPNWLPGVWDFNQGARRAPPSPLHELPIISSIKSRGISIFRQLCSAFCEPPSFQLFAYCLQCMYFARGSRDEEKKRSLHRYKARFRKARLELNFSILERGEWCQNKDAGNRRRG